MLQSEIVNSLENYSMRPQIACVKCAFRYGNFEEETQYGRTRIIYLMNID